MQFLRMSLIAPLALMACAPADTDQDNRPNGLVDTDTETDLPLDPDINRSHVLPDSIIDVGEPLFTPGAPSPGPLTSICDGYTGFNDLDTTWTYDYVDAIGTHEVWIDDYDLATGRVRVGWSAEYTVQGDNVSVRGEKVMICAPDGLYHHSGHTENNIAGREYWLDYEYSPPILELPADPQVGMTWSSEVLYRSEYGNGSPNGGSGSLRGTYETQVVGEYDVWTPAGVFTAMEVRHSFKDEPFSISYADGVGAINWSGLYDLSSYTP